MHHTVYLINQTLLPTVHMGKAAALPVRGCTYNLEVTCRDIPLPEEEEKKGAESDSTFKLHSYDC